MAKLVAVDCGNGHTNAVCQWTKTRFRTFDEPTARAMATGDRLGFDDMEMDYTYVDFEGQRWVTGDRVLTVTRRGLNRHMGDNRYGNGAHRFFVANALAHLGMGRGRATQEVELIVFAPPKIFATQADVIKERFMRDPHVEIKLSNESKPRHWAYTDVHVVPEGLAAVGAFILDKRGRVQPHANEVLTGDVIIVDPGAYTLDIITLTSGKFNAEGLRKATKEGMGVDEHIRKPVLQALKDFGSDFYHATVEDVDKCIRDGALTGEYTIHRGRTVADLTDAIEITRQQYADEIFDILESEHNRLRSVRNAILVGGGAPLVEDYLSALFLDDDGNSRFMDRAQFDHLQGYHPAGLNALGGLQLIIQRKLAQAKVVQP